MIAYSQWNSVYQIVFICFGIGALYTAYRGFYESAVKKNPYGMPHWIQLYGAFVWGDAAIFGVFWFFAASLAYYLQDLILFFLTVSVFLLVRSIGETIYWFLQQFAIKKLDPPETLPFHKLFPGNAIWFVYQIYWQCVTVITLITTIYLTYLWLK